MEKTALITGATQGIGRALAAQFAEAGWNLVLVARRADRLQEVATTLSTGAGCRVDTIACDLTGDRAVDTVAGELDNLGIRIGALVNNAGVGDTGPFARSNRNRNRAMIQLNVTVPTELTWRLLPHLQEAERAYILNVASIAAFQPGPLMAVYYATKAYALSLSEALAAELRGTRISVTALCPGPVRTGFQVASNMEGAALLKTPLVADVQTVARYGFRKMLRGKRVAVPGARVRVAVFLGKFVPRRLLAGIVKRLQERRNQS